MGMTEQEALEVIKDIHSGHSTQLLDDDNTPSLENILLRSCEALDMSINALERQIAKKPILDGPHEFIRYWHCPDCKGIIGINQMYCDHCGKAIDWGNEDAE